MHYQFLIEDRRFQICPGLFRLLHHFHCLCLCYETIGPDCAGFVGHLRCLLNHVLDSGCHSSPGRDEAANGALTENRGVFLADFSQRLCNSRSSEAKSCMLAGLTR